MKITFPHMGTLHIPEPASFGNWAMRWWWPQQTKRTLDLGTKYSPEWACLPLKLTVGNYIEALEKSRHHCDGRWDRTMSFRVLCRGPAPNLVRIGL